MASAPRPCSLACSKADSRAPIPLAGRPWKAARSPAANRSASSSLTRRKANGSANQNRALSGSKPRPLLATTRHRVADSGTCPEPTRSTDDHRNRGPHRGNLLDEIRRLDLGAMRPDEQRSRTAAPDRCPQRIGRDSPAQYARATPSLRQGRATTHEPGACVALPERRPAARFGLVGRRLPHGAALRRKQPKTTSDSKCSMATPPSNDSQRSPMLCSTGTSKRVPGGHDTIALQVSETMAVAVLGIQRGRGASQPLHFGGGAGSGDDPPTPAAGRPPRPGVSSGLYEIASPRR